MLTGRWWLIGLLFVICHLSFSPARAQSISGTVTDEKTGEAVPFATVSYHGHGVAVVSDINGHYTIGRHQGWSLTFSAVGYQPQTLIVSRQTPQHFDVLMKDDTKLLKEVTVRSKRSRYSRKNNPAVELMKKVIAAKKRNDLANRDFYQYNRYQKLTLSINDLSPSMLDSAKDGKKKWYANQIEVCPYNNKLVLPVSVDETVVQKLYRKQPHGEKTIVKGRNERGLNDFVQTGSILNDVMKDLFTDVDIYDDQIRLLQYLFTSPIGKDAIGFYRFYIQDTLYLGRDRCYHLSFLPNNQQDFGFRGELYVLTDSTYQVKRCELTLPKKTDVNFVDEMQIVQEFEQLPDGSWVLTADDMFMELSLVDFLEKAVVVRNTRNSEFDFSPINSQAFRGRRKELIEPNAMNRDAAFWNEYRLVELTRSEDNMGDFIKQLEQVKGFKYLLWLGKAVIENFIETSVDKDHPSKVDIGPVNTFITSNFVDGMRNRLSAQTTANLDSSFFAKGYYAHGWKSKKDYYSANLIWSFNKKQYLPNEFPVRTLTLSSTYDVMSPSDKFMQTDKDNVFTSFKWTKVDRMMFYNRQAVAFEWEDYGGLRTQLQLKAEENEAVGTLYFIPLSESGDRSLWTNWSNPVPPALTSQPSDLTPQASDVTPQTSPLPPKAVESRKLRTTEVKAVLRYAPGETYINTKQRRQLVNLDAPVYTLSHTLGIKGFLGGDYNYNYTEASFFKRFWLNSWGRLDCQLKAGIEWNQVPFPLLIMPEANLSYFLQTKTFGAVDDMEFLNDRFASVVLKWDLNGKLFNRIPLLRRLKWRERLIFRTLWGGLSDKNNPFLPENAGNANLMYFPETSFVMDTDRPYMEATFGVYNILKFFHVEYVRRLNYLDHPNAHKHGVRFGLHLTF